MDISDRRHFTNKVLNTLPDGIITMLSDGRLIHINLEAQKQLHINASTSEKFKADTLYISDLFCLMNGKGDILPEVMQELEQEKWCLDLPENTYILDKTMHTIFPVKGQFFSYRTEEGVKEIIFYFHNITSELTQEFILNTAIRRTRIYPWFLDIDRGIFVLDPRYFEYLGISPGPGNTLTMEEYNERVHPDDRQALADAFQIQFSGNVIYEKPVPFRIRRGDGRWEWFEGQSTYIGKLSGLPYRLVGICMSIQEHKNIEESLIAARNKAEESDRLKSAFLANMSHEIRTPLNAIVGFSDVLCTSFEELPAEERDLYVSVVKKNSAQLLVLINDILDLSRIESNSMEFTFTEISLPALLREVYQEYRIRVSDRIEFELKLPAGEQKMVTDANRLKQVLNNLVGNAFKFTSAGQVSLGFTTIQEDTVQIFVEDTGCGIAQTDLEHIFERFYKVDSFQQGTGLGLSICETIVKNLKGRIEVLSTVNEGTRFTVVLPLYVFKDQEVLSINGRK